MTVQSESSIGYVGCRRWWRRQSWRSLLAFGLHQSAPSAGPSAASATGAPAPAGSSAPLDPRIATVAAHHPNQMVSTIIQFKGNVSPERARWDVSRACQRARVRRASHHQRAGCQAARRARPLARRQPGRALGLAERAVKSQSLGLSSISGNLLGNLQNTYDQTLNMLPAYSTATPAPASAWP